jgi:hypothetical protein
MTQESVTVRQPPSRVSRCTLYRRLDLVQGHKLLERSGARGRTSCPYHNHWHATIGDESGDDSGDGKGTTSQKSRTNGSRAHSRSWLICATIVPPARRCGAAGHPWPPHDWPEANPSHFLTSLPLLCMQPQAAEVTPNWVGALLHDMAHCVRCTACAPEQRLKGWQDSSKKTPKVQVTPCENSKQRQGPRSWCSLQLEGLNSCQEVPLMAELKWWLFGTPAHMMTHCSQSHTV